MNELEEKARERIAQLEQEIELLRNYLAMSGQAREVLGVSAGASERVSAANNSSVESAGSDSTAPEKVKKPRAVNPPASVLIPAVIDILRSRGHPLSRRGIYLGLKARGLEIQGSDPVKAVGTILWRNQDKIVQLDGYGYWPKDEPYSRSGYTPEPRPHIKSEDFL